MKINNKTKITLVVITGSIAALIGFDYVQSIRESKQAEIRNTIEKLKVGAPESSLIDYLNTMHQDYILNQNTGEDHVVIWTELDGHLLWSPVTMYRNDTIIFDQKKKLLSIRTINRGMGP